MRKPAFVKGFKNSQKIRAVVDGVGFYMTVGEVSERFLVGNHRIVVQMSLERMARENCGGVGQTISLYDHRMMPTRISVQVDLM